MAYIILQLRGGPIAASSPDEALVIARRNRLLASSQS